MLRRVLPDPIGLSGILNAYVQSVWTLTFMRLTAKPPQDTPPVVLDMNA